ANVAQTVLGALLLFALYRYINTALGVERLGIWSVVLATASAANLANLGLSGGVVRFVARDRARGDLGRAAQVVDTAAITLAALVGVLLPLLYPSLAHLLPHLFQAEHLSDALSILPYALLSLWVTMVASVFSGALDGCERMDLRAGLVIGGQLLLLPLAFWLVPRHGLVGLAWAQIGQGAFLLLGGRLLLTKALPGLPLLPSRWRTPVLREMLGYGANIQLATLFMLMLDPVVKALMARFGGAAAAGYFEMANQLVVKVRGLIVMANQAVVPHAAVLAETAPERLRELYRQNVRALVFIALPTMTLLFAWAGGASWLLIGDYRAEFVAILGLLALAWGANIFCGPAYFINLGSGRVGWNTLSHIVMGATNAGFGWALGTVYGPTGVIAAYAFALIAGSAVLIVAFQRQHALNWRLGLGSEHGWLVMACAIVAAISWWKPLQPQFGSLDTIGVALWLAAPMILATAAWTHPLRKQLWSGWTMRKRLA
ncbi:MAG TPA: lipopolysaccharide biosynthesis protein, partial [Bellilinea sp.]|nr:lipopolysaccharide biosynthesis protein [Bellilinea sp.]